MPYCPECGTHYEDMDPVCPSCGRDFPELDPELEDRYPINETVLESEIPIEPSVVESINMKEDEIPIEYPSTLPEETPADVVSSPRFNGESHLGKGVIKPQAVEQSIDGYHFKYDVPQRNFVKAEPIKGVPQEYRVTSPDPEVPLEELQTKENDSMDKAISEKASDEKAPVETDIQIDPVVEERKEELVTEIKSEEAEPVDDHQDSPAEDIREITETEPINGSEETEKIELEDTEVMPTPVLPEPEITEEPNPEIMWEGRRTWLKFPLGNIYRISEHSLIVFGRENQKLLEINLDLIISIYLKQSWFAMLLGIGNLELKIRDFPAPQILLEGIDEPHKVKHLLEILCQSKL